MGSLRELGVEETGEDEDPCCEEQVGRFIGSSEEAGDDIWTAAEDGELRCERELRGIWGLLGIVSS